MRCFEGDNEKSSEGQHMRCSLIVKYDLYGGKIQGAEEPLSSVGDVLQD